MFRQGACFVNRRILRKRDAGHGWYKKYLAEGQEGFRRFDPPTPFDWTSDKPRPRAFFQVSVNDVVAGKLEFELAQELLPMTVHNFLELCSKNGNYSYLDTPVHRIIKKNVVMCGDVERKDGSGGHSAFVERYFEDEGFFIPHSTRGLLSMASIGRDTNNSQVYITLDKTPHLDGYCVAFGRLVEGEAVLAAMSSLYTVNEKPVVKVRISNCGIL